MYEKTEKLSGTRKLTMLAMFSALAYVLMAVARFPLMPSAEFLKYDPKDIIIAFAGLLYGPMPAMLVSLVVSLVEMVTVSTTGPIGFVMNVLSTAGFVCTASVIYQRKQTLRYAVIGLLAGVLMQTGVMLLWNYLITPLYMNAPRERVAAMLLPVFLPFNLLKDSINATLTLLLYKPLVRALRAAGMVPPREAQGSERGTVSVGVMAAAGLVLVTCILVLLVFWGKI